MSDDALLFSAVYKIGEYANITGERLDLTVEEAKALFDEIPVPLKLAAWKVHNDNKPEWITLNLPPKEQNENQ